MSNLSKVAFSVVVMALAASSHAAVTLITPEEIPVLALNQQEVSGNFFRSTKTSYKLDPGMHDIAVRYEQLFNLNNGEHDILKSAVISVRADLQDNRTYYLRLVNPPKDYNVAKDYVKQPIIAVMDDQGKIIAQQQGLDNAPKPVLGSSFFNRVMDFRDKLDSRKDYTVPVSNHSAANSSAYSQSGELSSKVVSSSATSSSAASSTVEQLKQLWQQTNEQERQQFMQFIIR